MLRFEELFGGRWDGLRIEIDSAVTRYISETGQLYMRMNDGRMYAEGCRWDMDGNQWARN